IPPAYGDGKHEDTNTEGDEMDLINELAELIPAIERLHDETLRTAVLQTWEASMKASPFDHLDQVPQSPVMADRGLLRHVNEVNERAIDMIGLAKEHYSLDFDHDVALATAILHDVDKPLIFRFDGTAFSAAPGTNLTDPGTLGATSPTVVGVPVSAPIIVAPSAMHGLVCDDAEAATARAAGAVGTAMTVSLAANLSMEAVAAAAPDTPKWFQTYLHRDRGFTAELT